MDALDGNAIAGPLLEYLGVEMAAESGSCTHCGASARIAELRVYSRAPGVVVRCPSCGNVAIVVTNIRKILRIDHSRFKLPEAPGAP